MNLNQNQIKQLILKKLSKELASGIHTEESVLYFLAETRKILDLDNKANKGTVLYIFCNWVLHSKLDHKNTKTYFSNKFERYIDKKTNSKEVSKKILSNQRDFFKLNELKNELRDFLNQNKLKDSITSSSSRWIKFITPLLEILKECPIEVDSSGTDSLSITEDKKGISCYRFKLKNHLSDNRNIIKVKIKIK